MADRDGREAVCWLLDRCGVFAPVHDREGEGARRIGLVIMGEVLSASPTSYFQLLVENAERIRDGAR